MDLAAVKTALAAAADDISGLNCYAYVPDSVITPCFYMAGDVTIDFDRSHGRGLDQITLTGVLLACQSDVKGGQALLDSYLAGSGVSSIKDQLEDARGAPGTAALSGAADDFRVTQIRSYRRYEHAGEFYLGAEVEIHVYGRGAS